MLKSSSGEMSSRDLAIMPETLDFSSVHVVDNDKSGGVGLVLGIDEEDRITVLDKVLGSPAYHCAGLSKGDILVTVAGCPVNDLEGARLLLTGPVGSNCVIGISKRVSYQAAVQCDIHLVQVQRQKIELPVLLLTCWAKAGSVPNRKKLLWLTIQNGMLNIYRKNPESTANCSVKFNMYLGETVLMAPSTKNKESACLVCLKRLANRMIYVLLDSPHDKDTLVKSVQYWHEAMRYLQRDDTHGYLRQETVEMTENQKSPIVATNTFNLLD